MKSIRVTIYPRKGAEIRTVCGDVKELSEHLGEELTFQFNGVDLTTDNKSINEMVDSYIKAR